MRLPGQWVAMGLGAALLGLPLVFWGGYSALALYRGEHFYHGLPSSAWASAVERWHRSPGAASGSTAWLRYLGLRGEPSVLKSDRAAVPVLCDLLRDSQENVRRRATEALGRMGAPALAAVPALLEALSEESVPVRSGAAKALLALRPPVAEVMPTVGCLTERDRLGDWLAVLEIAPLWRDAPQAIALMLKGARHYDAHVRNVTIWRIGDGTFSGDVRAKHFIPLLREAARTEKQWAVRLEAASSLYNLDPNAARELEPMLLKVIKEPAPGEQPDLAGKLAADLLRAMDPDAAAQAGVR
jgi:hypothetical protein